MIFSLSLIALADSFMAYIDRHIVTALSITIINASIGFIFILSYVLVVHIDFILVFAIVMDVFNFSQKI